MLSCCVVVQGKRQAVEEPADGSSDQTRRVIVHPSAASLVMRPENHPWLKWPNCNNARKVELNNKLALLQDKVIGQPRIMDWNFCAEIGISNKLNELFKTRCETENGVLEIPVWKRALDVRELSYREWMLEFYSSLEVDECEDLADAYSKPLISFRLGGKEHKVTVPRFGILTGIFSDREVRNESSMLDYLVEAEWGSGDVVDHINDR